MAWRERRKQTGDAGGFDLRLRAADRVGGPPEGPPGPASRKPRGDAAPSRKKGGRKGRLRIGRVFYWGAVLALWAVIAGIGMLIWIGIHLPPIQSLEIPKRPPSVLILGDNGATLATRGEMGGAAVPLAELPDYVPKAFVAIEDRRFYLHRGVSEGGSTITQQLAKNLFLTQERTVSRKLQEIALALWLEHKYSKAQI